MTSVFPPTVDSFSPDPPVDGFDDVMANDVGALQDAIIAAQTFLAQVSMSPRFANVASMTGNVTLTDASLPVLSYSPTAARDLTLPAVATTNHPFFVVNRSGTYSITIKNASAATIAILLPNKTITILSDGSNGWYVLGNSLTPADAATLVGAGDANALHIHGTPTAWTPVITFGGGSTGITYGVQTGVYIVIGKMLMFGCNITLTNKGSSTGTALIIGLPNALSGLTTLGVSVGNSSVFTGLTGALYADVVGTSIRLIQSSSTGANSFLTDAVFTNTTFLRIGGWYPIA